MRRGLVELFADEQKDQRHDHIDDTGNQEGEPETDESSRVGGSDSCEGSDVDGPVEEKEPSLDGDSGIDNDSLARLGHGKGGLLDGDLITK